MISENGIRFFQIPAKQFKTISVRTVFYRPLCREEAAKNALITKLLKSGTVRYPSPLLLNRALDDLYGASLTSGIIKKGEVTAVSFDISCIKDSFVDEPGNELAAIRLLCNVISEPVIENDGFSVEFFKRECENLKMKIQNRINDKKSYAEERCYEEMCKEEAFGIEKYGRIEDLEQLNPQILYRHYQTLLQSPMDVFVCGDTNLEDIVPLFSSFRPSGAIPSTSLITQVRNVKHVTEEMDVNQGKLSMGFRTGIGADDPRFPALYLYNSILGAGVHSKLFRNVREKRSLCYYAYSRLERLKGTMMISSGIEFDQYDEAYREILLQVENMKLGNISEQERTEALSSLTNQLKALSDTPAALLAYAMTQALIEQEPNPEDMIRKLESVTIEQIREAAQTVALDTVYFLKNKKEESV